MDYYCEGCSELGPEPSCEWCGEAAAEYDVARARYEDHCDRMIDRERELERERSEP